MPDEFVTLPRRLVEEAGRILSDEDGWEAHEVGERLLRATSDPAAWLVGNNTVPMKFWRSDDKGKTWREVDA